MCWVKALNRGDIKEQVKAQIPNTQKYNLYFSSFIQVVESYGINDLNQMSRIQILNMKNIMISSDFLIDFITT